MPPDGTAPVALQEGKEHHHAVNKRQKKNSFSGLRNIVTNWSSNHRIPLLSPKSSPTSPTANYGAYKGIVHDGLSSTIQLYEKSPGKETVAIKTFHLLPDETQSKFSRLADKSTLLSLNHPNIIKFFDILPGDTGNPCLVMEYCDGGNLHALATTTPKLDTTEIDCVFKQMIRGVHYLHWNGIIHGHLKPGNILFTCTGTVKVTGFDIVQYSPNTLSRSMSRGHANISNLGPYSAPEVHSGGNLDLPAIDIWALGTLYLFLRNGRPMWSVAKEDEDRVYSKYLDKRIQKSGFSPIEALGRVSHPCISFSNFSRFSWKIRNKRALLMVN